MLTYKLIGFYTVTFWGGGTGFKNINITTDKKGLKKIEKEPLRDYLQFGVENTNYVNLEVYEVNAYEKNGKKITEETINPIKRIEKGKYTLSVSEQSFLFEDEVTKINY